MPLGRPRGLAALAAVVVTAVVVALGVGLVARSAGNSGPAAHRSSSTGSGHNGSSHNGSGNGGSNNGGSGNGGSGHNGSGSGTTSSQVSAPSAGNASGEDSAAVSACRDQLAAASAPIRAAAEAVAQWRVHVVAMNKLVAGTITLAQASVFWNQSRMGAMHRVAVFRGADLAYRAQYDHHACAGAIPPRCRQASLARLTALGDAERTITTWSEHIVNMNMLRAGQLSPAMATSMWVTMWQRGVFEIVEFHTSRMASVHARC
jgi:hypothetical protein